MAMAMKIIGLLVLLASLMWIEISVLKKKYKRKDVIVFILLMIIATGFSLAKMMKLGITTPAYLIAWLYRPISHLISLLQ